MSISRCIIRSQTRTRELREELVKLQVEIPSLG